MQRVGGVPSGLMVQHFVNGGFETGDFTGWATTGTESVQQTYVHSGKYAMQFAGTNQAYIDQTFSPAIPVNSVVQFGFFVYPPSGSGTMSVGIFFTIAGGLSFSFGISTPSAWYYVNGLPWISPAHRGDTITAFYCYDYYDGGGNMNDAFDDFSLVTVQ